MIERLEELIRTLNEYDDDYAEDECIACKLFHAFLAESSLNRDIENTLICIQKFTFEKKKTE